MLVCFMCVKGRMMKWNKKEKRGHVLRQKQNHVNQQNLKNGISL